MIGVKEVQRSPFQDWYDDSTMPSGTQAPPSFPSDFILIPFEHLYSHFKQEKVEERKVKGKLTLPPIQQYHPAPSTYISLGRIVSHGHPWLQWMLGTIVLTSTLPSKQTLSKKKRNANWVGNCNVCHNTAIQGKIHEHGAYVIIIDMLLLVYSYFR